MGIILVTAASILALTALVVGVNKTRVLPWRICPICAGVSLTWAWMLTGMLITDSLLTSDFRLPTSILMGGSIVGIGYRLEDRVRQGHSPLLWKTSFMTTGFALVMSVLLREWATASALLLLELGIVWWFVFSGAGEATNNQEQHTRVSEIEERMKKCC